MNEVQSTLINDAQPASRIRGTERVALVRQGLQEGKSQRRIAAELGVDEGTVRRDRKKLQLPEPVLAAIENGDAAEQYLRGARYRAAEDEKWVRIDEELMTARHSNTLSRFLLRWLRKNLGASYAEQLLDIVARANWLIGDQPTAPCRKPYKTLAFCERGEAPNELPELIEFYVSVWLKALPLIAPERMIRARAIEKALRVAQERYRY